MRVLYLPQRSGNFSGEMKCNCSISNWKISEKRGPSFKTMSTCTGQTKLLPLYSQGLSFPEWLCGQLQVNLLFAKMADIIEQSSSSVEFKNFKFTGPGCNSLLNCGVPENILPTPWMVKLEIPRGWGGWVKG